MPPSRHGGLCGREHSPLVALDEHSRLSASETPVDYRRFRRQQRRTGEAVEVGTRLSKFIVGWGSHLAIHAATTWMAATSLYNASGSRNIFKTPHQDRADEKSTGTPRNIHEWSRRKPYPEVVMRGAFVVQLRKASQSTASQIEGSVEEVDTGKQSHFRSENELIGFLRERFAEIQSSSRKEGTNERNDHGR
jgi:hypothetical protein